MKASSFRRLWFIPALFVILAGTLEAQQSKSWSDYLGGPEASHYSPLKQVNRDNAKQLAVAWSYETGDETSYTFSPLVVDNIAYMAAKQGSLVAVDAATGKELWVYKFQSGGGGFGGRGGISEIGRAHV